MAKLTTPMPSKGVRMPAELWAKCDEMTRKLGLELRNEYIRNAIEFYTEWNEMSHTQKFLTPALESVISAKVLRLLLCQYFAQTKMSKNRTKRGTGWTGGAA